MKQLKSLENRLPYILIACGFIGLGCAFMIMYEKLNLLANPGYAPPCNINPIISCGSVMKSAQSHVFGFPNPLIGLAAFPVLITVGMALLAGAQFTRWFWRGLNVGALLGVCFISWLFFESVYRIGALCPFCMVVWVVTILTFWYVSLYNLREGHIAAPPKLSQFVQRHHLDILLVWYVALIGLALQHFWSYFGSKF